MHRAYKGAVLYFALFSILLLISAFMLFEQKIGFSVGAVLNYYQGSSELYISPKSISGILKIILPHIFLFGLFGMLLLHFVFFTKRASTPLLVLYFITASLELFSPFLIVSGYEFFAYLKLGSFFLLELLILYILWILFESIVKR